MNESSFYKKSAGAGGIGLLVFVVIAGFLTVVGYIHGSGNASADPSASGTIKVAVADCRVMAAHYVQMSKGFTPDQYVIGKIDAKQPGVTANRGNSFSDKPVYTKAELRKQLKANTTESVMVISSVQGQINGPVKPTVTDVQDVDHWVSVQYKVPVVWPENTTFVGGGEKPVGTLDNGLIGEVSWVYVSKIGCEAAKAGNGTKTAAEVKKVVDQTASKRGACLNGNDHPKPKPPNPTPTPTPTPSSSPSCPPGQHGTPPICKDGPENDPQSNGNVPPAGTKDRPSDDNASEVARPPETPSDSGNGIPASSSPRATPSAQPSSSAPPSGPGPTTLPAPTSSPQPGGPAPTQPPKTGTPSPPPPPPA